MDEGQPLEGMVALDRAVHVDAAARAGMAQDQRRRVDHLQLVAVLGDGDVAGAGNGNDREDRAVRLLVSGTTIFR